MNLSLIIPTYNEKENIPLLLKKIEGQLDKIGPNMEVIVVDDNSPDGTGKILDKLKSKYNFLEVIHRKGKSGLSSAVLKGFSKASGDILGVMDADLSHPPKKIRDMLKKINEADLVIGSRYANKGKIMGWSIKRKIMSKVATLLARGFTSVKDPMSGFFLVRKNKLPKNMDPKGFKILLEILVKGDINKIEEVPITFKDREKGKSKANLKEIFSYISNLYTYFKYEKNIFSEFIKFCTVGFMGTLINLCFLYFATEFLDIHYILSATFAFFLAASHNYILNKFWTFKESMGHQFFQKYLKFFAISLASLGINLIILYSLTELIGIYYILSQLIAIGIALSINFTGNKFWTFINSD